MPINLQALGVEPEQPEQDDLAKRLAKQLTAGKSREDLIRLAGLIMRNQAEHEQADSESAEQPQGMPQTPDELWDYIVRRYGVRIARVSVCPDHDTPFDYVCAGFFKTYPNVFCIGPRGGGKSALTALLHDLNAHFFPGIECATFGAVEEQAKRVYSAFKAFVDADEIAGKSLISETVYKPVEGMNYGSKVEVLGCLPGHGKLQTPTGNVRISEIVSQRLPGPVKSFNYKTRCFEWQPITDWFSNGKQSCWLTFKLDISTLQSPNDLYITPNHMIPDLFGVKRRADEFKVGDEFCVPGEVLSEEQDQVLIGKLLGDGHITPAGVFEIAHCVRQRNYVEWAMDVFSDFSPALHNIGKPEMSGFRCRIARCFSRARRDWYPAGVKRIPNSAWLRLDALGLATWIMDDGCAARIGSQLYWEIAAHHFNQSERDACSRWFAKAGMDGTWRCVSREKDQHVFVLTGDSANLLYAVIAPYLDISEKQEKGYKRWVADPISTHSSEGLLTARIVEIGERSTEQSSYDISVPPNCNYVVSSGVICANSTLAALNGPHPMVSHSDEVEIMRPESWRESRNLASARTTPDGRHIKAQNLATSTMKWKGGRVWQVLESFRRAKEKAIAHFGAEPENKPLVDDMVTKTTQFYVLSFCLKEVAEQVPNCREAPENAHLPEWEPGLDHDRCKCDCDRIQNGVLEVQDDDGEPLPRTLASECGGDFYRSRGHRTRAEVIQLFLQNDARTWSAQQLCRETETEGLYIPSFSRNRHGLARFPFDLANGPVYTGTDWGFVDEAAVLWTQYLERAVEAIRYDGKTIILPRGARVAISELTISQKTATELGQMAILREVKLASVLSINRVAVRKRWADLQGAGDRRDWSKLGLKTARYSTRDFGEHVREWRGLVDANRFYVVVDEDRFTGMGCPVLCEQLEGWREEDGKESRELPQHVVSAGRYVIYGMHDTYLDSGAQSPEQTEAVRMAAGQGSAPAAKRYHEDTPQQAELAEAAWRSRF